MPPLVKNLPKIRKKGEKWEKERKIKKKGEKRGKSGKRGKIRKKRQNSQEGSFILPLLTDRAGYATTGDHCRAKFCE